MAYTPMATKKVQRKTYRVRFERGGDGYWFAKVLGVKGCHTQGRSLNQARTRIREAMEACGLPADARLDEIIRVGKAQLDAEIGKALSIRQRAERLMSESAEATKLVARDLVRAGISRRDVGEMVGLSFQRIHQLVDETAD